MGLQVLKPNAGCWENARNARDRSERDHSPKTNDLGQFCSFYRKLFHNRGEFIVMQVRKLIVKRAIAHNSLSGVTVRVRRLTLLVIV